MTDAEDIRDAAFFRLWIKLASTTPGRVAKALAHCLTPNDYRAALSQLATEEKLNLPPAPRRITDACPYPDQPGWTMADCFAAKRCACADGHRLGYQPTTRPIEQPHD